MKPDLAAVFLLDAVEHARGTVLVYRAAADCATGRDRRRRFAHEASAVEADVAALEDLCSSLGVKPEHPTAAREIVKDANEALVKQLASARAEADPATAETMACQCLLVAETRSVANLELLERIGTQLPEAASAAWCQRVRELLQNARERLAYARMVWEELLVRRIELDSRAESLAAEEGASSAGG